MKSETRSSKSEVEAKPFGWDVTVEFSKSMVYVPGWQGNWTKDFHYKGASEASARRRAMEKTHARAVIATKPIMTEKEYIRIYGNYWEKGF